MSIFRSSHYLDCGFRIPLGVIFKKIVYYATSAKKRYLSSIHYLFVSYGNYHVLQYLFNSNRNKPQSD